MLSSDDLWRKIHQLHSRNLFVGLQMDAAGINAWITDKHYLKRAECQIELGPALMMGHELHRWLDAQASKIGQGRAGHVNVTVSEILPATGAGATRGASFPGNDTAPKVLSRR